MIVLALDGALGAFTVAVARDDAIAAQQSENGKRALEAGLAHVASVMQRAGVLPADLDRITVGIGPGGFTGLRIALSYAKALALAWRLPLVAISSYDLLEDGARPPVALTVVSGRRGIVCARFRSAESTETACGAPAEVVARLLGPAVYDVTLFGEAEGVLGALAERGIHVTHIAPSVAAAVAAALMAAHRTPARTPHEARPEYGEQPAATPPRLRGRGVR